MTGRRALSLLVVAVATGLAALFAWHAPWRQIGQALGAVDPRWIVLAAVLHLVSYPLWAQQWRLILPDGASVPMGTMLRTIALVSSANGLVPFGGPAAGLYLLASGCGLRASGAVAVLMLDQLLAGLTKVALAGIAILLVPLPDWMHQAVIGLLLAVPVVVGGLLLVAHGSAPLEAFASRLTGRSAAMVDAVGQVVARLDALRRPVRLVAPLGLTIGRKALEIGAASCVAAATGIPDPVVAATCAVAAISIVTSVPLTPGHVGTFEAAAALAYQAFGATPAQALAAALLQHALVLTLAILPGYALLLARQVRRT